MTLQEYLKTHNISRLADRAGVSRQAMYNYNKGEHLPNLKTAAAIEKATNGEVTLYDWDAAPKEASLI